MEGFEDLVKQYTPMVHRIIRSLHIYKNVDEFYQLGLIALWEAQGNFKAEKGNFFNYAYTFIKGRILTEMTHINRSEEKSIYPKEEYWETVEDQQPDRPLEVEIVLSYCKDLTEKERRWVLMTCIDGMSVREIAEKEGVSLSAVKQWRISAKNKIKGQLEKAD
ncbi:sigma-70 family RNA polymerase sigma factor [Neobacillus sp. PS3-34]|uniref:sigma-70 family RNA polymerase sigma factor n=1 Tax=Neobacillus sp. PS3-34 TaxID=3070678 RepID=UPI0027DF1CB4|nr:sigma-70 family RNA polymerase sigma factor [Neobacillus sp. PS3-34]WML46814.1 sigma-70 family RNA polymerase sigma factor [Neobacillus sp. PS3-34]